MTTKKQDEKIYLATMRDWQGPGKYIYSTHEVTMDQYDIYFVRNKDGVNAWHCGSLPKTDHRIVEIIEKPNE